MCPASREHRVRALGIDPGLAATGFAVLGTLPRGGELCRWGVVRTSSRTPASARLEKIYTGVRELMEQWHPILLVVEDVYVLDRFPRAAIQLGEVRGVIALAAHHCGIELLQLPPTEVKRSLTGNGRARKDQVGRALQAVLGVAEPITPDHAADAGALALVGLSRKGYYRW